MAKRVNKVKRTTRQKLLRKIITAKPRMMLLAVVLLFGITGSYLLYRASAADNVEKRSANYEEIAPGYKFKKVAVDGPCKGESEHVSNGRSVCSHTDSEPQEWKKLSLEEKEAESQSMVEFDANHPALDSDAPAEDPDFNSVLPADGGGPEVYPLSKVAARNWPCVGTGSDYARVQALYLYREGNTNRLPNVKATIDGYAKRMNNVVWLSGHESGGDRQIRFRTSTPSNGACSLTVYAIQVPKSINIFSAPALKSFLESKNYKSDNRKYMSWIDMDGTNYNTCGEATRYNYSMPGIRDNPNNILAGWAFAWRQCWNLTEPHELMHTLGAVQSDAPHKTRYGHCYDGYDVMCYDDDGDSTTYRMTYNCNRYDSNNYYVIDYWRYDCGHNDYFSSRTPPSGTYLYNHWNAARSRWLYPNTQF